MDKYRVTLTAEERVGAGATGLQRQGSGPQAGPRPHPPAGRHSHGEEHPDEDIVDRPGHQPADRRSGPPALRHPRASRRPSTASAQPPRPDKIKIKGDLEQKLVKVACSDPPQGRCHWTLQLLADELVVLGLVDAVSTRRCGRR